MSSVQPQLLLGAHVSAAGGLHTAFAIAQKIQATCFQLFTHSNRQWHIAPLKEEEIQAFHDARTASGITHIVVHASYLINCASPEAETRKKSVAALIKELQRARELGIDAVVLHPGSRLTASEKDGIAFLADSLDQACHAQEGPAILLENMAGQGSSLGSSFEQLAAIHDQVHHKKRIQFCFDTCHAFAAGYDMRTHEGYETVLTAFDRIIGLNHLKAIHLNDSKTGFASHVDRHAHIGQGTLGEQAFALIMNDERLFSVPKILETPKDDIYQEDLMNMATLKELISPKNKALFRI